MEAVPIRGRCEAVDQFPLIRDQAHVNSLATEIQTNVQHEHSFLSRHHDRQDRPSPARTVMVVGSLFRMARPRG